MSELGFTILLADDDPQRNDLLSSILEASGYHVVKVFSGLDAIDAVKESAPDMLLLDVRLPDINGFEVLQQVKQGENSKNCFVIMISSLLITSSDQSKGFEAGADGYLVFPMSNREFKARINAFVRHKSTLDDLQRSELALKAVLENSEDGIIMLDVDGKITFANKVAHRMFSIAPGHFTDLFFGEPITSREKTIIDIPSGSDVLTVELKVISLNHVHPGVSIVYLHDITERRLKETKMSEQIDRMLSNERQQDKLFSLISHDLRSPFNILIGLTDFLLTEMESISRSELATHVASVNKSAQKVFALLLNLLDWSRLKTGSWYSEFKEINLNELANNVLSVYIEMANYKKIVLENKIDPTISLNADYNILHSVLRNLLANAIKYTNDGGHVVVNAIPAGAEMILQVTDNGAGMSSEKIAMLFDKGRLGEKSHPESGTGLGLQLCKDLIESAGGRLDFSSETGKGTTVSFVLPVHPVHP